MGIPLHASTTPSPKPNEETTTTMHLPDTATRSATPAALPQVDGGADYHSQPRPTAPRNHYQSHNQRHQQPPRQSHNITTTQMPPSRQQTRTARNPVNDLLPYCTMEAPLNETQVIALSDIAGSLRELMLLALAAGSGDGDAMERLESAVGQQSAVGIIDFFADEWEIDG